MYVTAFGRGLILRGIEINTFCAIEVVSISNTCSTVKTETLYPRYVINGVVKTSACLGLSLSVCLSVSMTLLSVCLFVLND